jgi:hypothetical protein
MPQFVANSNFRDRRIRTPPFEHARLNHIRAHPDDQGAEPSGTKLDLREVTGQEGQRKHIRKRGKPRNITSA